MGKAPDDIRQEIEETRARMGDAVEAIGYKADVKARAKESIAHKKENVVDSIKGTKDRMVDALVGAKDSVSGSVGNATGSVSEAGSNVAGRIADATPTKDDLANAGKRAAGVAQENPMGLAIGSFAVGFLAGMMVPATRFENQRIGPLADQLKEKVSETGHEALERGAQVARETAQVAQEAAQEAVQRTTATVTEQARQQSQELASSARENASSVAEAAPGGNGPASV